MVAILIQGNSNNWPGIMQFSRQILETFNVRLGVSENCEIVKTMKRLILL